MRLLRFFAFVLLACAVATGAVDWTQYSEHGGPMFRSATEWWMSLAPGVFEGFQGLVETNLGADLWNSVFLTVLMWPASLVLALLAILIFMFVGFLRSF